ncbi:uncharacterized protein LOC144770773 isoform X4 [Lissotriton helveticus]
MRTAFSVACFLASLCFEGNALSCISCSSRTGPSCTGQAVMCDKLYDVCFTKYSVTRSTGRRLRQTDLKDSREITRHNIGVGKTTAIFIRNCGTRSRRCDKIETVTATYVKVRGNTTCCNTDNCEPAIPTVPKNPTKPNGVKCRTCTSLTSTYCYTENKLSCLGAETKCVLFGVRDIETVCLAASVCHLQWARIYWRSVNWIMSYHSMNFLILRIWLLIP